MKRLELLSGSFCADFSWRAFSFILAAVAVVVCFSGRVEAEVVAGPVRLNPANGHSYQVVWYTGGSSTDRSFATALAAAAASTHNGVPGHLVTITSPAEQLFLEVTFPATILGEGWIGASDAAVEGEWRWITGPEAGQLFWKTEGFTSPAIPFGTAYGFESWRLDAQAGVYNEPNNSTSQEGEDFATISIKGFRGRPIPPEYGPFFRSSAWNDLPVDKNIVNFFVGGYFVEYSVPEPGSAGLVLASVAGMGRAARRRLVAA